MNSLDTYLERAKIEELIAQFTAEGYEVIQPDGDEAGFDLVLRKGDKAIVIEVRARSRLRESAGQLSELRARAHALGYDDFRVVVVSPPHEPEIKIEGLGEIFQTYLNNHPPATLQELAGHVKTDEVHEIEIDSLRIAQSHMELTGTALARVSLEYRGGENDGLTLQTSFPVAFRIELSRDLDISHAQIEVDTSSWED